MNGKPYDRVQVPSSQRPLGFHRLKRNFLFPRLSAHQRAILHFEGITYHGRVFVNGAELGTTAPYVPHEFEFTKQAKEGSNEVDVAIVDLIPDASGAGRDELALGVNPGWEAYGGIIRDVYAEPRPAAFIENVRFGYTLRSHYAKAECRVQMYISSLQEMPAQARVSLLLEKSEVAAAEKTVQIPAGASELELEFDLHFPTLWSPNDPNLYELRAKLSSQSGEDAWSCRTGFREVSIRGRAFELNGKRLVLNGICRHDMWKDQGFTLTRKQMEQDMGMIKALGCNFVRLVHYPHHRYVVELADELGLLVSEEPGYWGMDFTKMPRSMIDLGLRIMERVIRRDWNSPSVFAWLLGNECKLTVDYLREGKELCNRLDPLARLVSFANDMRKEDAMPIYERAGMDFFDQHIYPSDVQEYARTAEFYPATRPLTFTEWGWEQVGERGIFLETHSDLLLDLVEAGQLAGHAFWSWQDIREYGRIDWPTQDGILSSGVVTEAREPRKDLYMELAGLFQCRRQESQPDNTRVTVLPLKWLPATPGASFQPLDLQFRVDSPEGNESWAALESSMASFWSKTSMAQDQWRRTGGKFLLWQESEVQIAGIPFRLPLVHNYVRPIVLTSEVSEVTIPVGSDCARLHILGHVTLPVGFPLSGRRGEVVAAYTFRYGSGSVREVPLRNGIEVAQANLVHNATRIDPVATAAQRALEFVKDVVREQYQALLWSVQTERGNLDSVHCRLNGHQPALAIFAVTVELP